MTTFTGISHVDLSVTDVEASAEWYAKVLGLKRLVRQDLDGRVMVVLAHPETRLVIGLNQHHETVGDQFDEHRPGLDHVGFGVVDRAELDRLVANWTSGQDAQALMLKLQAMGVPAGAVQDAHDVTRVDPQLAHRGHWVRLPHAEMGESLYNNLPFRFSRVPVRPRRPAPLLGEHTREILRDLLGFTDAEMDRLQAEQVLK